MNEIISTPGNGQTYLSRGRRYGATAARRRFEQANITYRVGQIRQDQIRGIRARRPGGLRDYWYDRAAMRAAQRLATERKRRDRRGAKHGRPAPRGVMQVHAGVGLMIVMPNFGRALEQLAKEFQHLGVAAIAATDTFADIRERVALQQARDEVFRGVPVDHVIEDEAFGNEPVLEIMDDTHRHSDDEARGITRETLMDVMQREC